jgi:hypothetical protein
VVCTRGFSSFIFPANEKHGPMQGFLRSEDILGETVDRVAVVTGLKIGDPASQSPDLVEAVCRTCWIFAIRIQES